MCCECLLAGVGWRFTLLHTSPLPKRTSHPRVLLYPCKSHPPPTRPPNYSIPCVATWHTSMTKTDACHVWESNPDKTGVALTCVHIFFKVTSKNDDLLFTCLLDCIVYFIILYLKIFTLDLQVFIFIPFVTRYN